MAKASKTKAGVPVGMERPIGTYTDDELLEIHGELSQLVSHPSWPTLSRALNDVVLRARELGFEERDKIDYWAGVVDGIKEAWDLPGRIKVLAERVMDRDQAVAIKNRTPRRSVLTMEDDL